MSEALDDSSERTFAPPFDHAHFELHDSNEWRSLFASRSLPKCNGKGAKVAIVGAGIAGMLAAYELNKRNFSVRVLEREPLLGGRIRTHRFDRNSYGELGAMRISHSHACVLDYVRALKLDIREFANWNPSGLFHLRGKRGVLLRPGDIEGSFAARAADVFPQLDLLRGDVSAGAANVLFERLAAGLRQLQGTVDPLEILRARDTHIPAPSLSQTLHDFAIGDAVGMSEDDWLVLSRLGGAAPLANCCLQQFVLDMLPVFRLPMFELVGGMSCLIDAMASSLPPGSIRLSADVQLVQRRNSSLSVTYLHEDKTLSEKVDYVMITVPPRHLPTLRIVGSPAAERLAKSIAELQVRPLFKCLALCSKQYWAIDNDLRQGGLLPTDTQLTQVWYPSPQSTNNNVMTAAYAFAGHAEPWADISEAATVKAQVIGGLHAVHPEMHDLGDSILELAYKYWDNGYTYLEPRTYRNLLHSMATNGSLEERILFAGEHMGPMHGWIVSAVMPAQYALELMLKQAAKA